MVTYTWPRWEEKQTAEISVLKQTYLPHAHFPGSRGIVKREQNECKSHYIWAGGWLHRNCRPQSRAAAHMHLTCTARAKTVQAQSIANPSMSRVVVHTLPPLGGELLAIVRFCEERQRVPWKSISSGKVTTVQQKTTHPQILAQHKLDLKGLTQSQMGRIGAGVAVGGELVYRMKMIETHLQKSINLILKYLLSWLAHSELTVRHYFWRNVSHSHPKILNNYLINFFF